MDEQLSIKEWLTIFQYNQDNDNDNDDSPQDNQDGNLRRGSLHLQTQREGQEGQVVHQEPGKVQEKKKHFCFAKNHIP